MTVWDGGVANERTALAWQRTALAGFAGAAIVTRLTWEQTGVVSLLPVGVSALVLVWLFREAGARYRPSHATRSRDGLVPALLSTTVAATCLVQIAAVLAAG